MRVDESGDADPFLSRAPKATARSHFALHCCDRGQLLSLLDRFVLLSFSFFPNPHFAVLIAAVSLCHVAFCSSVLFILIPLPYRHLSHRISHCTCCAHTGCYSADRQPVPPNANRAVVTCYVLTWIAGRWKRIPSPSRDSFNPLYDRFARSNGVWGRSQRMPCRCFLADC